MLHYYFKLALNSVRRSWALTALTVAAVAIGIGGSMSTYTIYYAMSGDPIPWKSATLFVPQIDNLGPTARDKSGEPPDLLSYQDAIALANAHQAKRQAAMYATRLTVTPPDTAQAPFAVSARATGADFFTMFDVPFRAGAPWNAQDEEARSNIVVLGSTLADKLFHGAGAIGKTVVLDGKDYLVSGVIAPWNPAPRFYDLGGNTLAEADSLFLPFTTAIDRQMNSSGRVDCDKMPDGASRWQSLLASNCIWTQLWVELPTPADAERYKQYLDRYAADQQRAGRFNWPPLTRLRNAREWLVYKHVVPDEVRAIVVVGFGFLIVCLINAIGLMQAKFATRAFDLGVRRALGATQLDLFAQCLTETAVIGLIGGAAGLALTFLGAAAERAVVEQELARVTHVNPVLIGQTLVLAIFATVCAGIYPAWRASRTQPALQLKAQ